MITTMSDIINLCRSKICSKSHYVPIAEGISNVFRSATPLKIFNSVVYFYIVKMTSLLTCWYWPRESLKYECMYRSCIATPDIDNGIADVTDWC